MRHHKLGARAEYRQQEEQKIKDSASLAEKFRELKFLTVEFGYFNAQGVSQNRQIKYTVNLAHAKSVFRFPCHNHECVRGDFDLSEVLAEAVAAHRTSVSSEMVCQGWHNRATIDTVPCHNILRYKLTLGY